MKIVFTGGGTAGHIFPILAVVRELNKELAQQASKLSLFYLGPKDDYALNLLRQEGVTVKTIAAGKLRRYFSLKNLVDLFKMPIGFCQALAFMFIKMPDMVFSKGGYGSLPAVLAAKFLQIPIFLHESDSVPGLASKFTSRLTTEIFTSFPKTAYFKKEKIVCVGNPIRRAVLGGNKQIAQKIFQLEASKPLLFIIGGSQGAESINNLVLEILPEMLHNFELVHQTGKKHFQSVKAEAHAILRKDLRAFYHPIPFLNEAELKHILAAAHLVISRAGSGALFEITANHKPSLLLPLPSSAQGHQEKNAYCLAEIKAAEVLLQENLKPHFFLEKIRYLFSRPTALTEMSLNAKYFSRPKAAQVIAHYLIEYINQIFKLKEKI